MNVHLSPTHEQWLSEQVSRGTFASADDAVGWAIEGVMHLAEDALAWAQPYLEKGEDSLARGGGIPGDEFLARRDGRLDTLR